jgi:ribosome recycling factor
MTEAILKTLSDGAKAVVDHLHQEFAKVQTGRANPAMVEHLMVDSYGTKMPLKSLANISIPDAKTISIQPWDRGQIASVEKAIRESNLGLNPMNNGLAIHLNLPPLTEERRRDQVKVVGKIAEEAKVSLRTARHEALDQLKKLEKDKEIGEDLFRAKEKEIQAKVDEASAQIEEAAKKKEKDIMTV